MTSDDGTTKSQPTPTATSTPSEGSKPSNYSRGENQKPVTNSYKENWNRIYGKKKTKRSK